MMKTFRELKLVFMELKLVFMELSLGVRRLIFVGTIPGAFQIGGILGTMNEHSSHSDFFFGWSIFAGIPIYWICVFAGLWIYQGFKEK